MPGSPPTSPRFGVPRYADSDSASFSSQVNAITDAFDVGAAKVPSVVTTPFPASPQDGDEIEIIADAVNGVVWRFRYRAASTSTFKWEFVGGAELYAEVLMAAVAFSNSSFGPSSPAGPQLTLPPLPNGGDFDVTIGASLVNTTASSAMDVAFQVGAAAVNSDDIAGVPIGTGASYVGASVVRKRRKDGIAGGTIIKTLFLGTGNITDPWISILPVRVG